MYKIPFGKSDLEFDVPSTMKVDVAEPKPYPPLADLGTSIDEALANPVGSKPLGELAKPTDKVCIVITDITRSCPDEKLVRPMLKQLETASVPDENITILVGVGMHRASTDEEKVVKLGKDIVARYNIVDHDAENPDCLVDLGLTSNNVPVIFNKIAYESDLLIATGIVEPHQYAGFSGCRKTVAVGIAGEQMISYTHGAVMLDHPKTRLANLDGNPFHIATMEIADNAKLRFCINVVKNGDQKICAVKAGEPKAVFENLVSVAKKVYTVPVPHTYDAVICGVGFPKDANLYQASRGPSYIFFAPTPIVEDGGLLVVAAPCEEGAGEGTGEERFFSSMKEAPDMASILHNARTHGYKPGEQRAFVMAKVMEKNEVVVVGSECPDVIKAAHMKPIATMNETFKYIEDKFGKESKVLIVPHALQTLPVVKN
jgi:nickel-dependent lactate racemase